MDNFLLLICLLLPVNILTVPVAQEYDHSVVLDPEEKYLVHWKIDRVQKKIHFALQVNTTGWVGFGIANSLAGKMEGADIVIGYVVNNNATLTDRHGTGHMTPVEDEKQDYHLENGTEADGQTILKFYRDLVTCDSNDHPIKEGTLKLLYAYNDADPDPMNFESSISVHSKKGSKSMNLREFVKNTQLPPDTSYIDIVDHQVNVPSDDTTYWCSAHKIPNLGGKKHVIEIAPIIQRGHESLIHHIVLYQCKSNFNESYINSSAVCYTANMPPPLQECAGISIAYAWAIGSQSFKMPENVGMPIGASAIFIVMEMHYDNPLKRSDYVDSSGLRLYYTDNLRQHDAGSFNTGIIVTANLLIPPGQKEWNLTGYCTSLCSSKLQSSTSDSIHIFASMPHAHLAGRKVSTSLFRNGSEASKILNDESYDFNFQQMLMLEKEVEMKPGDELVTTCTYDTRDRATTVWGGLGTKNEMCINFLMYYPATDFTGCSSEEIAVREYFVPKHPGHKSWTADDWTSEKLKDYQSSVEFDEALSYCYGAEGRFHGDIFRTTPKPKQDHFLHVEQPCKGSSGDHVQPMQFRFLSLAVLVTLILQKFQ